MHTLGSLKVKPKGKVNRVQLSTASAFCVRGAAAVTFHNALLRLARKVKVEKEAFTTQHKKQALLGAIHLEKWQ